MKFPIEHIRIIYRVLREVIMTAHETVKKVVVRQSNSYNPANCEQCTNCSCLPCDGAGHCISCNDDPNKKCCPGGHCCDINTTCCDEKCYDFRTQKCCQDISLGYICDINYTCCNGSCCDPSKCEDCNSITHECEVCGGDPNKKCCNGQCIDKCKIINGQSCTDPGGTLKCNMTCVFGGGCELVGQGQNVYSDVTEKICNPQGCTGDCDPNTTWCVKTYDCVPSTDYVWASLCTFTPSGIPLDHAVCDIPSFSLKCFLCTTSANPDGEPTYVEFDSCN